MNSRNPIKGGEIRRSQLITTYGVGAIVAVGDESFMVVGIDRWDVAPDLHEPRLESALRVTAFALPPATDDGADIPVIRFPTWVWCPGCDRLAEHRFFANVDRNRCNICDQSLVPSRFVMACAHGHIDDFPYFLWVHRGGPPTGESHAMRIRAAGASAALRDIEVSCACGKSATMDGAFGRDALRHMTRCTGRRPWLADKAEACDETPRALQRGASNVWFPILRSALSIPPWSEGVFQALNRFWPVLRSVPESALRDTLEGAKVVQLSGYGLDDLVTAVGDRKRREADPDAGVPLREAEHEALIRGRPEFSTKQEFVSLIATVPSRWSEYVGAVRVVSRLREVRVLEAFSRVTPPSPADPPERRAPLYSAAPGWLPGMEVIGEGVFLALSQDRLTEWERSPAVQKRGRRIDEHYAARFARNKLKPDRSITPRFLLVHTLAHLLIGQWSLDSGYPAASLRERLYVSPTMAAFMIYTATSDSAGSLGGIVAQAAPERLELALTDALDRGEWCSADPLCVESSAQGVDALNLAACHACVLLPEVSCEEMNVLLDRGLVVGTLDNAVLSFFGRY